MQAEASVCSNCKCCDGCRAQCACTFAIHDPDTTLAELLLGQETEEYLKEQFLPSTPCFCSKISTHRTMKAITPDWVSLEDEEVHEREEDEDEDEDEGGENFSETEIFELY